MKEEIGSVVRPLVRLDRVLKRIGNVLVSTILLAVSLAFAAPSYEILDSGFPAADRQVYWMDRERVIFVGYKVGEYTDLEKRGDGSKGKKIHTGIFIWDTQRNQVTKYADSEEFLCYADGYIVYSLPTGSDYTGPYGLGPYKAGKMGVEKTYERRQKLRNLRTNTFTCKDFDYGPSISANRHVRPLRDEHGYLDLGVLKGKDSGKNESITLISPAQTKRINVAIGRREIDFLQYYAFENAYFIQGPYFDAAKGAAIYPWPKRVKQSVWWLYPEGKVSKWTFSDEPWKPYTPIFFPTKKGLFMQAGRMKNDNDAGTLGGYLYMNDKFLKLISGHLEQIVVSPDGSKVVFLHVPSLEARRDSLAGLAAGRPGRRTLKMVSL